MAGHKSVTYSFITLIISVTLTLVVSQAPNDDDWLKPDFCSSRECPQYDVMERTDEYEVRMYEPSAWVSTSSVNSPASRFQNFMRLFRYIGGNNQEGKKIAMTVPVLKRVSIDDAPSTMSFFVSPSQGPAPQPKDSNISIDTLPRQKVYVRTFGGFAKKQDYIDQADALSQALPESAEYFTDFWYTAGYNSPYQLMGRHNEVWFIAK